MNQTISESYLELQKELHKNLALDYYSLKKIDYAISQCKQILEIDRKNMWALSKLILFYQAKKEWKKSKKYLELKLKYCFSITQYLACPMRHRH